jgi:2-methylcitrate dehydratase PrpD
LEEFSEAAVHDPAVVALRAKTEARVDAASPRGAATAEVFTHDGRHLRSTVLHAKGSKERPLSDEEIEVKVRQQAAIARIDDVIAAVWRIDTLADVGTLLCASC